MPRQKRSTRLQETIAVEEYRQYVNCHMTEAALQQRILRLAKQFGWRRHHGRPARKAPTFRTVVDGKGQMTVMPVQTWTTPIQGDAGFPDLVLAKAGAGERPARLIIAELKTERGTVSDDQQAWLAVLAQCPGLSVYVWRPSSWDSIVEILTAKES